MYNHNELIQILLMWLIETGLHYVIQQQNDKCVASQNTELSDEFLLQYSHYSHLIQITDGKGSF